MIDSITQPTVSPRQRISAARKGHLIEWLLAFSVIAAGTAVRMRYLDASPFWVDEAESSINALTILQNGYPTDSYLGMPIYENTYLRAWPESSEYEFRDSSYSENHFAIYHGWLPLYSIAGSFALLGIRPDVADASRSPKHTLAEEKRRTKAGRLPGVLFGSLFLLALFVGGRVFYGRDAGWAALILGSVNPYHIELSRQARYYSAQLTLTTACCIVLWLLVREGKWKHVYLVAVCFILLFHTHLLSFLTAVIMFVLLTPFIIRRNSDWVRKISAVAALVAIGTVPWIIITEFYRDQSRIPRAWTLLNLPVDLFRYPPIKMWALVIGTMIAMLSAWIVLLNPRVSYRISSPFRQLWPVLLFLAGWGICGYAVFLTCMPAVSFTNTRLNLSYWGPLFLLGSAMSAAVARALAPRISIIVSPAVMFLLYMSGGHNLEFVKPPGGYGWPTYTAIFNELSARGVDSKTKIYAAPNDHLTLTFYSGLPIQDITPVRKSFLDSYRGNIVYIDPRISVYTGLLTPERVQEAAFRYGQTMSRHTAERWSLLLSTRHYRETMTQIIDPGETPELETLPPFAQELLIAQDSEVESVFSNFGYELVTRGFKISDWSDWCRVLKYRYVDPESRRGIRANYADRFRGAGAVILALPAPVAIYYSSWPRDAGPGTFTVR